MPWSPLLFSFLLMKSSRPELEFYVYHSLGAEVRLTGLEVVTKTCAQKSWPQTMGWETWRY